MDFMIERQAFTIADAIDIAYDPFAANQGLTSASVSEVIFDGIENGYLPDNDYYHALARAASRIPDRSLWLMANNRP